MFLMTAREGQPDPRLTGLSEIQKEFIRTLYQQPNWLPLEKSIPIQYRKIISQTKDDPDQLMRFITNTCYSMRDDQDTCHFVQRPLRYLYEHYSQTPGGKDQAILCCTLAATMVSPFASERDEWEKKIVDLLEEHEDELRPSRGLLAASVLLDSAQRTADKKKEKAYLPLWQSSFDLMLSVAPREMEDPIGDIVDSGYVLPQACNERMIDVLRKRLYHFIFTDHQEEHEKDPTHPLPDPQIVKEHFYILTSLIPQLGKDDRRREKQMTYLFYDLIIDAKKMKALPDASGLHEDCLGNSRAPLPKDSHMLEMLQAMRTCNIIADYQGSFLLDLSAEKRAEVEVLHDSIINDQQAVANQLLVYAQNLRDFYNEDEETDIINEDVVCLAASMDHLLCQFESRFRGQPVYEEMKAIWKNLELLDETDQHVLVADIVHRFIRQSELVTQADGDHELSKMPLTRVSDTKISLDEGGEAQLRAHLRAPTYIRSDSSLCLN